MFRYTIYSGHRHQGWRERAHKNTRLGMRLCALQMGPGAEVMDWKRGIYHAASGQVTQVIKVSGSEPAVADWDRYWFVVTAVGRLVGTMVVLYVVMDLLLFIGLF